MVYDTEGLATQAELAAEQAVLDQARADLGRMRERAANLSAMAGDAVSAAYLAKNLAERVAALTDDGTSALIFGRLDMSEEHPAASVAGTTWRVGRRHVVGAHGGVTVFDWRARVSRAFYQASTSDPMHVLRRRRYGIDEGRITAFEDEDLTGAANFTSDLIAAEIERPRVGPMRDIVATIAPEQDTLVRTDSTTSVVIQGAPGTGKTAVGLHRAAWLLYEYSQELARAGVLVIGPGEAFLEHIAQVLPALGEVSVEHTTALRLVTQATGATVRGADSGEVAKVKSDARLAPVLERALWSTLNRPTEPLKIVRGARTWRVPDYVVRDVLNELRGRGLPFTATRDLVAPVLARRIIEQMNAVAEYPDSGFETKLARDPAMKKYVKDVWPVVKPTTVLWQLFTDPEFLSRAAKNILTAEEQEHLLWKKKPRSAGSARWSAADVVLLDELVGLMQRTTSYGHVIVDEAQDLSPMQLRAVGRRAQLGSVTVLGDLAQGTTPWAATSWQQSLQYLGHEDGGVEELTRGFRVPASIIDYASRLLPHMAEGLNPPQSLRHGEDALHVISGDDMGLVEAVRHAFDQPGSVGVIVADADLEGIRGQIEHETSVEDLTRLTVIAVTEVKGLEFDSVVVIEPANIVAAEPTHRAGLRRLYVALTRAVSQLCVYHQRPIPPELSHKASHNL